MLSSTVPFVVGRLEETELWDVNRMFEAIEVISTPEWNVKKRIHFAQMALVAFVSYLTCPSKSIS